MPRVYGLGFHPYFVVSKTKDLIRIDIKAVEPLIAKYYTGQSQSLDYLEGRYDFSAYKLFDLGATEGILTMLTMFFLRPMFTKRGISS